MRAGANIMHATTARSDDVAEIEGRNSHRPERHREYYKAAVTNIFPAQLFDSAIDLAMELPLREVYTSYGSASRKICDHACVTCICECPRRSERSGAACGGCAVEASFDWARSSWRGFGHPVLRV